MSFYTVVSTELKNREYIISAITELVDRGEAHGYKIIEKNDNIVVERGGEKIVISVNELGEYQVEGDSRVVEAFAKRLKQMYAYASIKANLPLDFEISSEKEFAGDITLLLKG